MPRVSFFYGIGIWMYFNEGVHNRPHFHARYSSYEASNRLRRRGDHRLTSTEGTAARPGLDPAAPLRARGELAARK